MKRTSAVLVVVVLAGAGPAAAEPRGGPVAVVRPAPQMGFAGVLRPKIEDKQTDGEIDCNSPAHWDGDIMYMFYSTGHPWRSSGPDFARLSRPSQRTAIDNDEEWHRGPKGEQGARWIEATHKADDGKLYAWYHNEPPKICGRDRLTAPRIGQMVSTDNGMNWHDQGLVLEAPADSLNCETVNHYFVGGNGDFCVNVDNEKQYVYFFISTYNKDVTEQGVSLARMKYADRDEPKGKVFKWYKGRWDEPGIGGHVTPIFPARIDWHQPEVDAFWGASVHWNTYLRQWVMLLNRARDKAWAQEGVYVSFSPELGSAEAWSKPVKIVDARELVKFKWYPQVVGQDAAARETDKLAGRKARLFVAGLSRWEIEFYKPGETKPAAE
ncbi:MAG: hypothetical protein HY718_19305 [Planctomycetes bacterium]|nr:hypothetical protein [Planctomycetota bacterium]